MKQVKEFVDSWGPTNKENVSMLCDQWSGQWLMMTDRHILLKMFDVSVFTTIHTEQFTALSTLFMC